MNSNVWPASDERETHVVGNNTYTLRRGHTRQWIAHVVCPHTGSAYGWLGDSHVKAEAAALIEAHAASR
jgi:hypothetical protein